MSQDKPTIVTPENLKWKAEYEGLAYAVQHYYGRNISCPYDPELERLWKAAYDAIEALDKRLDTVELDV